MGTTELAYLIIAILFLFVCAFFSAAEIGYIRLHRSRLRQLQDEGTRGADRVAKMMENPSRFLSTVLTGISFAETVVVSLGTIFIVELIGNESIGPPVAIVIIAMVLLIFAKVIPKTIAAKYPERIALPVSPLIELISKLIKPLVNFLSWISDRITHLAGSSTIHGALFSKEELATMIDMGEEEGVVDRAAAEMMRIVVNLGDRQVKEVMTPRTEATWLAKGITLADFLKIYAESPAHRYPVYEESYDNVEGTLSSRDMLIAIAKGEINQEDTINDFIRPVHFVPGSKTVGELFNDMRIEKYQMAVVLNEYGGTSGIVTIDQLVEHIVGEIGEELVAAKKGYEVVGASMYKIQGNTKIEDVNKELKLGIPEGDYQTVGGFALHLFGRLPKEGEKITAGELRLLIAEVKENKITRLFITKEKKLEPQGKAK